MASSESQDEAKRTIARLRRLHSQAQREGGHPEQDDLPLEVIDASFESALEASKSRFLPLFVVLDSPMHEDSDSWLK